MGVRKKKNKKEKKEYAATVANLCVITVERLTCLLTSMIFGYLSETYINCKQRMRIRFGLGVILSGCLVGADNQR